MLMVYQTGVLEKLLMPVPLYVLVLVPFLNCGLPISLKIKNTHGVLRIFLCLGRLDTGVCDNSTALEVRKKKHTRTEQLLGW